MLCVVMTILLATIRHKGERGRVVDGGKAQGKNLTYSLSQNSIEKQHLSSPLRCRWYGIVLYMRGLGIAIESGFSPMEAADLA